MSENHEYYMQQCLDLAREAEKLGEVPVGALVVRDNEIIGRGFNRPISSCDPSAHAEVVALREAAQQLGNYRLPNTTLYVTVEPCTMCAGALIQARVAHLVFGTTEPKSGAVCSHKQVLEGDHLNHRVQYTRGVLAEQCAALIQEFFRAKRRG